MALPTESQPHVDLLLPRVAKGEPDAVKQCVTRFGGLVWSLARRLAISDAEAEDAVQEIFVEIWQNAHKYDPSIASETAFIAMIARRRLIDRRRALNRRPVKAQLAEEFTGAAPPESDPVQQSEQSARAADALEKLSEEQRRVLRMSIYQGLSHEKISRATGLPLGTVKTHARRGLLKIREMLGLSEGEASS